MNGGLNNILIVVSIFLLFGCKKGLTEAQSRQNLHYFERAFKVLMNNKNEMLKIYKCTKDSVIVIDEGMVKNLLQKDTSFGSVLLLWDNFLIASTKSIYYNCKGSVLFVLPQKSAFVVYDPFEEYQNTCGNSEKVKYLLENKWYFLHACEN